MAVTRWRQVNHVSPTGTDLPVRYAAMKFLMIDRGSGIRAADLDEVSSLELQQWAKAARIEAVYEMVEVQVERKDDATRMGLAAIIAGADAVDLVLTKKAPATWATVAV